MDSKQAEDILARFRMGTATEEEQDLVREWLMFGHFGDLEVSDVELSADLAEVAGRLPLVKGRRAVIFRLWPWIAAAAAVVVVLFGLLFYDGGQGDVGALAYGEDIAPGRNGATLTLADGRKILIDDALSGDIAEEAGVRISKAADGQILYEVVGGGSAASAYNVLATARGQQSQVRLPDGTLVLLNAESSLRYPASFVGRERRRVELSGEGYFEVAGDKAHPFEVVSGAQTVEVLGTHFNINAYNDNNNHNNKNNTSIRTTLLEGSVKVSSQLAQKSMVLKPGEQSKLNNSGIDVTAVDTDAAVAWKDGKFIYERETMEEIMKDISRWYNVEVVFNDADLKKKPIYITAKRFGKISEFLKPLGRIAKADFKIEKNRIVISKKEQ